MKDPKSYIVRKLLLDYIFSVVLIMNYGCDPSSIDPDQINKGYEYYPLDIGNYREYEVIEKIYFDGEKQEKNYFLKEIVTDTFSNQAGELSFRIRRYTRSRDTVAWDIEKVEVWTAVLTKTRLVVYENNTPFVKLTFPVKKDLSWDGNAFNTQDEVLYSYTSVREPFMTGNFSFKNSAQVLQKDFMSLIDKDVRKEIYADSVGMVYKEFINLKYVDVESDPDYGKDIITNGNELIMQLIDYGKE